VWCLLDNDVGDGWLVVVLQLLAGLSHGDQFLGQHGEELSFADSVSIHDDLLRLPSFVGRVELDQEVLGDLLHVVDHLLVLPSILDPDLHLVVGSFGFHGSDDGSDAWFETPGLRSWMRDVSSHHHDGPLQHCRTTLGCEDVVDSAEHGVDLQTDVADDLEIDLVHLEQVVLETTLGNKVVLHVAELLDLVVQESSFVGEDE